METQTIRVRAIEGEQLKQVRMAYFAGALVTFSKVYEACGHKTVEKAFAEVGKIKIEIETTIADTMVSIKGRN